MTELYTKSKIPLSLLIELEMTGIPANQREVRENTDLKVFFAVEDGDPDVTGSKRVY